MKNRVLIPCLVLIAKLEKIVEIGLKACERSVLNK